MNSSPILSLHAYLSAPPSTPAVYRDVSLYANVFCHFEVVAPCPFEEWDYYAVWFRRHGLFDYITEIVHPGDVVAAVELSPSSAHGRLVAENLAEVIAVLDRLRSS